MIFRIEVTKFAKKQLKRIPAYIAVKLQLWIDAVETQGLEEVRKIPGYHDEPLFGRRKGQRSIRLSLSYRAIYVIKQDGSLEFVSIEEVNKHEY